MSDRKQGLTDLVVKNAKAPERGQVDIWDDRIPGFGVRVTSQGTKTFVVMFRHDGRKKRMTLGRYPVVSLSDARKLAHDALNKVVHGTNPDEERRVRKRDAFATVVDEFVKNYCARHNRASTTHETERILRSRFIAVWGQRDVREITKADVLRELDRAVNAGAPSAANHALAVIRKFFNWCIERGIVDDNPCARISRPAPETARERTLTGDELAAVWRAADTAGQPFNFIVKLLMLTAQRRGEVAGMRWKEIDFAVETWTIPAERNKSNRTLVLPLSPMVIELIRSIPKTSDDRVFPARGNDSASPSGFSKGKRRLDAASKVTDWTLHDLRRTAATEMARLGVAPHVVERILNHTTGVLGGVAGIYNRFEYLPEMRAGLEMWNEHVKSLTCVNGGDRSEPRVASAAHVR